MVQTPPVPFPLTNRHYPLNRLASCCAQEKRQGQRHRSGCAVQAGKRGCREGGSACPCQGSCGSNQDRLQRLPWGASAVEFRSVSFLSLLCPVCMGHVLASLDSTGICFVGEKKAPSGAFVVFRFLYAGQASFIGLKRATFFSFMRCQLRAFLEESFRRAGLV